jgi:hypothetical protein
MPLSGILRPRWIVLVTTFCASLFFTACGSMVGGNSLEPGIAPQFASTPTTTASQGTAYTYQIATSPVGGGATLALMSTPSGAALSGNTLTWTPSAAQSRISNQFSVTATNAAGSATQSWTVTPSGTVTVAWVDTNWTPNGTVMTPVKIPLAEVLVPQPDGSFQPLTGAENPDGTFSIPNVPGGYYWLQVVRFSYWTSSSQFDLGINSNAPVLSPPTTGAATTQFIFNFAGLDPLQAQDELGFLWLTSPPFTLSFPAGSRAGATTLSTGLGISTNFNFSQSSDALLLQYEPETLGTLSVLALGPAATLPSLALMNGSANTINGTLVPSPRNSFDLNIKGSAWTPLFVGAGPSALAQEGADLALSSQSNFGWSIPLAAGLQPPSNFIFGLPSASACFGYGTVATNSSGSFTSSPPGPALPPLTADQDFGTLQYGDPFPSSWPHVFTFCQTAVMTVPTPGSATPATFRIADTQSTSVPASQISPLIGQVQNPTINGMSLFVPATISAKNVTLSWSAPTGTTPTGYRIETFFPRSSISGVPFYAQGPLFYTAKTSCSLPFLQSGQTYVFVITAVLDGAANFETHPNRSALPTAAVSVISAPMLMSN